MRLFVPVFLILWIVCATNLYATHNRAGEITYRQTGPLTIEATITTYTRASSVDADRDSLTIHWGDGSSEVVPRINGGGNGVELENDIKINIYKATHTYPGLGTYRIFMTDPNRNAGIINVNPPNSVNVPFHIETIVTLLSQQFQGFNSSPLLLQPPLDFGCVGKQFIHTPNADDPDGDSLAYRLIVPLQSQGMQVPNYSFPDEIEAGPDNNIFLNEETGEFIWNAPQRAGEYNIAILILEYRNGVLLNQTIRDLQILVRTCDDEPPEIITNDVICVVAGELIELPVIAIDPDTDPLQLVRLQASGGPFIQQYSPATFEVVSGFQPHPLEGTFRWQTTCEHIREQFYNVVFKATDNFYDTTGLSDLHTLRIKVVGPPPEGLEESVEEEDVTLTWEEPYRCDEAAGNYFDGFTIWRRVGSNPLAVDTCNFDMGAAGYVAIAHNVKEIENGRYAYTDHGLERGRTYCYRITAEFSLISQSGNRFNRVQSLPSEEICLQLSRDLPLILEVSVEETSEDDGTIRVVWAPPLPEDLDTVNNPGPYTYRVLRQTGIGDDNLLPIPGAVFTSPVLSGWTDTVFIDRGLNTAKNIYSYSIEFFTGESPESLGRSAFASSVYLTTTAGDESMNLTWNENTPWKNYAYVIERSEEFTGTYDSIGISFNRTYTDGGLVNGEEYCYRIRALGAYGIEGIREPLVSFSQKQCNTPIDTFPPCSPDISLINICNADPEDDIIEKDEEVLIQWAFPPECDNFSDLSGFELILKKEETTEIIVIDDKNARDYFLINEELALLCVSIIAIDSTGNRSTPDTTVCTEICPLYDIPNAFSPNNDGSNDLLQPFPYRFVDRIEMQIFNRWGVQVFDSEDPDINWDGTNYSGEPVAEDVYYYKTKVFHPDGISHNTLSGFIELFR